MEVPTVSVKDMLPFQRPREKFLALGPSHMAMEELLAILLRTGVKGQSAISLASDIVQSFDDGVYGLNRMTVDNLTKIKGIGRDKAVTLCAALEMGRRLGELKIKETYDVSKENVGVGSTIFAVKPGDGSAREQAASCQKVLGGWANIANEYATKRYRSNLINWGMLPFIIDKGELPFENGDYIFIPEIQDAIKNKVSTIKAFVVNKDMKEFELKLDELTDDERQIILDGCLINYYRENK